MSDSKYLVNYPSSIIEVLEAVLNYCRDIDRQLDKILVKTSGKETEPLTIPNTGKPGLLAKATAVAMYLEGMQSVASDIIKTL